MAVITVSREYASRGEQIAQHVAKDLGYSYFDKDILADVARAADTTEERIRPYDEKDEHGFRRFLSKFFMPKSLSSHGWAHLYPELELFLEWSVEPVEVELPLDADEVVSFFRHVIESLWQRDNVVIVGRGSQMILAEKPNTFHVRVVASIDDRVEQVMDSQGLIYPKVVKEIRDIDKQRACYLKHYYDADWAVAKFYHLVLNTSLMSIEQAVRTIITAVRHQENTPRPDVGNQMIVNEAEGKLSI